MAELLTTWFIPGKMHYNYFLELCSLVFMVAIVIAYYSRKKFPTAVFKLFGVCLISVTITISCDILSCYLLDNADRIPLFWCEAITELLYFSQILCSYLLFAYIFYSIGKTLRFEPRYYLTIVPSAICSVIIFTNCLHHGIFRFVEIGSGVYDFEYGPAYFLLYVIAGLNVVSTVIYAITFRKSMHAKLLFALFTVIALLLVAIIIHLFKPEHLLYGIVYTLAMVFIIITVNDPDEKVDRISKAFNNEAFVEYINNQRTERQRRHFIVFDIESFGMFNEKFGSLYANEVLSSIRKFIEGVNKKTYIFKTHSSRFVLMLRNREEQLQMVAAIRHRFSSSFNVKDKSIILTINLFYFENNGAFKNTDSYKDFVTRTLPTLNFNDSNFVELDAKFMERINRDRRIKEILEQCLREKRGLYMVYQPIYDVNNKEFNHFEALIRLDNDELGFVGPAEFIPIAENSGLANEIDYFVLNETCAFLARNPQVGILEVNISCAEFFNNPSSRFLKIIKEHNVDPKRICLEITETIAVKYPEKTKEFMADLGQYGVQFAMDDFGSGYSNIARFITLPFSIAKLDKTLLEESKNIKIFFDSAVNLFKSLGIPIVIEGVETETQLATSKTKKIEFIQGYYFSKPLKEEDLQKFLTANKIA